MADHLCKVSGRDRKSNFKESHVQLSPSNMFRHLDSEGITAGVSTVIEILSNANQSKGAKFILMVADHTSILKPLIRTLQWMEWIEWCSPIQNL